jgi:hypothetical protein
MSSKPLLYSLFGLVVQSQVPCPELSETEGAIDASILLGDVPESLREGGGSSLFEVLEDRALLTVPGVARYLISSGREIRVAVEPGADPATIRLFLLGTPMGVLLHQRGVLPLHASAVEVDGAAIAFVGHSGAGKSTMVAGLERRGHTLITDDICALSRGASGESLVAPGPPHMKLWADAMSHFFEEGAAREFERVRPEMEKYRVPTTPAAAKPMVLRRVYVLRTWNKEALSIEPLEGARKLEALIANTYRLRMVEPARKRRHFLHCAEAASNLSVRKVFRPQHAPFGEVVGMVLQDLGIVA